jgi:iron(III) transport system permease protein
MTIKAGSIPQDQPLRFPVQAAVYVTLLVVVGVFVLYPVIVIVVNSFVDGEFDLMRSWSIDPWRRALAEPAIWIAIKNTLKVVAVVESISLPAAVVISWLLARTDLPGQASLEFMFSVAFFLPALAVTVGWIVLLDPQRGLLNQLAMMLPFVHRPPFDIYTFWGIVWTHLGSNALAVKVMLITPLLRNLDAAHEEASRVSGAGRGATLLRIVIPMALPAILTVLVLAVIRGMQTFEIELVLGPPTNFWVFGTMIYRLIEHQPPEFGAATALAVLAMLVMVPLIVCQRWLVTRKNYASVGGRMSLQPTPLGRWRMPAFSAVCLLLLVIAVLPVVLLVTSTFMKLFGFFTIPEPWTLANWHKVLTDDYFLRTLGNTAIVAGATAFMSVILCSLIAYFVVRSRYAGRAALDFLSWLPFSIPGILLGVGLLYVVLGNPVLRLLYGGLTVLVVALVIAHMTFGTQILKAAMVQLSTGLEEAARMSGASWWVSFRTVVAPILMPTLVLVGTVNFIAAARDISSIALLASNDTKTLSLLQLDYLVDGRSESAAVVSCIVILITTGLAILARVAGLEIGLQTRKVRSASGKRR